jgi:alkylation response protein AidB-like acyl-CoA dehydrogenase
MAIALSEQNLQWQARAREVAETVVRPLAAKYDRLQQYPWEIKAALAEAGLFKVIVPTEYGGESGSVLDICLVVEQLSRACPGVGVLFCVNALGSLPIMVGGTEAQKQRFLPDIASGEKLISFCLSEKFAGTDPGNMQTKAVADGDEWVITGEKKWTTNGGAADLYTVFAVTEPDAGTKGLSAFIVDKGAPGWSVGKVEDKMGIRAVPVVEIVYDGVRVGQDRLLGGEPGQGFKHAMQTLDRSRPAVAIQGVGCAQGALEYAQVFTARRKQFGRPVNKNQMVQEKLASMAGKLEAARWLVYRSAELGDQSDPEVTKISSMGKFFATDTAMEVTTDAVQLFGGYGYMRDYPIEKYMRDAKITQIYEGTNQVQRIVVARALMAEAKALDALIGTYIPREIQRWVNDGPEITSPNA